MPKGNHNAKGRPPSKEPKIKRVSLRVSDETYMLISELAAQLGTTKTKAIIEAVKRALKNEKRKEGRSSAEKKSK